MSILDFEITVKGITQCSTCVTKVLGSYKSERTMISQMLYAAYLLSAFRYYPLCFHNQISLYLPTSLTFKSIFIYPFYKATPERLYFTPEILYYTQEMFRKRQQKKDEKFRAM